VAQLGAKHRSNLERNAPLMHSTKVPIHPLRLCKRGQGSYNEGHYPSRRWATKFSTSRGNRFRFMSPEAASMPGLTDVWVWVSPSESARKLRLPTSPWLS